MTRFSIRRFPRVRSSRRVLLAAPVAAFLLAGFAAASGAESETRSLVRAANRLATGDIAIAAACSADCPAERLPGSIGSLLPLIPEPHRDLIATCSRGRVRVTRDTAGFDLLPLIDEPAADPTAAARVRRFFDGRTVDVAVGHGWSEEPYPIGFDWVLVLDRKSGRVFSFVLNCRD